MDGRTGRRRIDAEGEQAVEGWVEEGRASFARHQVPVERLQVSEIETMRWRSGMGRW